MADFYKIAGMPRVIGAVDGSLIPISRPYNDNTCMSAFWASMPSMLWQCAMHNNHSQPLCGDVSTLHAHLDNGSGTRLR